MLRPRCLSKIHRATVTEANLNYRGSITLDPLLMEAADLREGDEVLVNNYRNTVQWVTYVVAGKRGSGTICLNGPPAKKFRPKDLVVILHYVLVGPKEKLRLPIVVHVDRKNKVTSVDNH